VIAYFDTSALLKFVLEEEGRSIASDFWERADAVVTCQLTYAEARAALAAALRSGRLGALGHRSSVQKVDERWGQLAAVDVDEEVAVRAGSLAQAHALSGADAIQLAAAMTIPADDLVFITWDRRLAAGAAAIGLAVVPAPA
jgi:hypothetical protein